MSIEKIHKKFNKKSRLLRFKIAKWIFDKEKPKIKNINVKDIKKVAVIRYGKIGDCIISSFIYRELKKNNSKLQIDVITLPKTADILESNENISNMYIQKRYKLLDAIFMGLKLRKIKYDVLIDLTEELKEKHLAIISLIDAKINVGYSQSCKLFNVNIKKNSFHMSKIYEEVLLILGCTNIDNSYDMPYNKKAEEEVTQFLDLNKASDYIAINFYGKSKKRQFSKDMIIKIIKKLEEEYKNEDTKIIILTFPEVTKSLLDIFEKNNVDRTKFIMYEGTTNIYQTIELIKKSSLIITPDTATVHIASGLNKKLIAFYFNSDNSKELKETESFKKWEPRSSVAYKIIESPDTINAVDIEKINFKLNNK